MKKTLIILLLLILSLPLFASQYIVTDTLGNVKFLSSKKDWVDIKIGQELDSIDSVNVGINAKLTLVDENGKKIVISSMRKGQLKELVPGASINGLKKASKIVASNIAPATTKSSKPVATAASRASEAKEDISWDEE